MLTLGPSDRTVLFLQDLHRSNELCEATVDSTLIVKRSDHTIWELHDGHFIHERVQQYLSQIGFYGILQCGHQTIDNHLITALVERWHRETHTFHFRIGEATVTLQDVEIIWGLNVDGLPLTGKDKLYKRFEWQEICFNLLGFMPLDKDVSGGHLSMTAIVDHCRARLIDDETPEDEVVEYTRCIALLIIGGCILPDSKGGSVKLMYLQFLEDLTQVHKYSWGSATLAFLYRELCNASISGKMQISGPLSILQIWAWSRLPSLSPDKHGYLLVGPQGPRPDNVPRVPYGARWKSTFTYTHTPTNSVRIMREVLDHMEDDQFRWIVYDPSAVDVPLALTPKEELTNIWRSVCPLICFDIVEMHRPNRVLRQFGMIQSIPVPASDGHELHVLTRQGRPNCDWGAYHLEFVQMWNNRRNLVASAEYHNGVHTVTVDYKRWYERITVLFISPATRGTGYRMGDTSFRRLVSDDAAVLMHQFDGMSLTGLPPEVVRAMEETTRIGRRLHDLANRMHDQPESSERNPQSISRGGTRRRRALEQGSSIFFLEG